MQIPLGFPKMEDPIAPHVLVLPFPAEGHIKPLFNLAKLLSKHGSFKITFIHSHRNYARLHRFTDLSSFHSQYPNFRFTSITDGLPPDHPCSGPGRFKVLSPECRSVVATEFRELFVEIYRKTGPWRPPTCIIADGIMSTIVIDVGEEFEVPIISFRTYSATCTWITLFYNKLVQDGIVPLQQGDMDKPVTSISGLEHLLRGRDLPSICRSEPQHLPLEFFIREASAMTQIPSLILNTFDELEAPIISKITTIFPKTYTVGPLHTLCKSHIENISPSNNDDCYLREEDGSCITWLDSQKPKTVLYVSFGTVVKLSRDQLLELWYGVVNSGKKFLWVIRPELIASEGYSGQSVPEELELGTKESGFFVEWAPQEEVLAHPAVGAFMTHGGWNSVLESVAGGVPMICWPLITDQMVNSRCVSEQWWRIGVDMKDTCDRLIVEKMVRDVMEDNRKEIMKSAVEIARIAQESVKEHGSSYRNLKMLVEDIKSIKVIDKPNR